MNTKEQQLLLANCTLLIMFNVITFSQVTVQFKIEKKLKLASFMTQTSKTCLVKIIWYCRLAIDLVDSSDFFFIKMKSCRMSGDHVHMASRRRKQLEVCSHIIYH